MAEINGHKPPEEILLLGGNKKTGSKDLARYAEATIPGGISIQPRRKVRIGPQRLVNL